MGHQQAARPLRLVHKGDRLRIEPPRACERRHLDRRAASERPRVLPDDPSERHLSRTSVVAPITCLYQGITCPYAGRDTSSLIPNPRHPPGLRRPPSKGGHVSHGAKLRHMFSRIFTTLIVVGLT